VTHRGIVTKVEWTNPHVYIFMDVTESNGQLANWAIEFDGALDLARSGWRADSVKLGDQITAQGILARNGTKLASGRSLTLPNGTRLAAAASTGVPVPAAPAQSRPAPRWPNGHVRLGPAPGEKGFWIAVAPGGLFESSAGNIAMNRDGLLANIGDAGKVAPFLPWAKGLYEYRQRALLKDDPMSYCLPPGGPRQFQDRYGVQIVEQPDRQRIFVMSGGANRNGRLIDMDGRALPVIEDITPTYYGYSSGQWDGDTLVVRAQAFAERFWFTNGGLPHTESLRLTERITRPDFDTLRYEVTVDDPGAYARPWTGGVTLRWVPNADIEEYFCDDNNKLTEGLSGKHGQSTP
jgi:hypothetical protein